MNRFKNYLWMAAGFTVLALAISAFTPGSALAQIVKAALVKNVDEPGRVPYQSENSCSDPFTCAIEFSIVPANKRLVAQYV